MMNSSFLKIFLMLKRFFPNYKILYIILLSFGVMFFEAFTISLVLPLLSSLLNGSEDYFLLRIYETYFSKYQSISNIYIISILIFLFFFLKISFLIYALFAQTSFYVNFKIFLSENIFQGYLKMPFSEHVKTNSALILRNTIIETETVAGILMKLTHIITETLVLIGISMVLIIYQPIGSIIIIGYVSFFSFLFYLFFKKKLLSWGKLRQYHEGKRIQKINEGIRGIIEVKLSKTIDYFFDSFASHNAVSNIVHKKRTIVSNLPKIWLEFILLIALISLSLSFFYLKKDFTYILPNLALFAAAAFRIIPSIQRILSSYQSIRFTTPAINRIFNELIKFDDNEKHINQNDIIFKNSIKFENVSFNYPSEKKSKIFDNFTFEIKKGDFIGVVGKSGTGKTTFFNLLSGLINPTFGKIFIDDKLLDKESVNWTNKVGYVPQETFILDSSLKENISLSNSDTTDTNLINKIIVEVDLSDLVASLDFGIDTNIGEGGQKISGGQRQRIGIARALYKNPSLLIFDEITSSLDKYTEAKIIETIKTLKNNKTILMISHRDEILNHCNKIYSLNNHKFI